jgi:hypothetical protein
MFKFDNITQGTWKPHFFDEDLFAVLFKLDNITQGTWKPHFFDRDSFGGMLSEGLGNLTFLTEIDLHKCSSLTHYPRDLETSFL